VVSALRSTQALYARHTRGVTVYARCEELSPVHGRNIHFADGAWLEYDSLFMEND
jgi:hypothetical protein